MSIDKLTEQEWQTNEAIARRLNVVIEAVEGLQGQADAHEAMLNALQRWIGRVEGSVTEEVGQAADPVEAPTVEDRLEAMQATWQIMSESYTDACAEAKRLRAERDALQARVAELEALYQAGQDYANARCQERSELVAEIDKWKAKAKALEPDAALGEE